MKTAISIPDPVFKEGERLAKRLKMSRSQLYATAVRTFVGSHRVSDVTRRIDEVLEDVGDQADPFLSAVSAQVLRRSKW
jgi:metal-responsive CopG/Arc/MetJ family transcriptional regulator